MHIFNIRETTQVVDDLGFVWIYEYAKIRLPVADADIGVRNNGYPCDSFEQGVQMLKEYGYITEQK